MRVCCLRAPTREGALRRAVGGDTLNKADSLCEVGVLTGWATDLSNVVQWHGATPARLKAVTCQIGHWSAGVRVGTSDRWSRDEVATRPGRCCTPWCPAETARVSALFPPCVQDGVAMAVGGPTARLSSAPHRTALHASWPKRRARARAHHRPAGWRGAPSPAPPPSSWAPARPLRAPPRADAALVGGAAPPGGRRGGPHRARRGGGGRGAPGGRRGGPRGAPARARRRGRRAAAARQYKSAPPAAAWLAKRPRRKRRPPLSRH